jgi:hypothetical protein
MLNCLRVTVLTLAWHHTRRAALPMVTLAVAVILAEGFQSTDNGYTRLLIDIHCLLQGRVRSSRTLRINSAESCI